jgi:hypothetical protein
MEIEIYGPEQHLADYIRNQNKITFASLAEESSEFSIEKLYSDFAIANSNPNQEDLYYFNSILVSTGWNLNDDVFSPEEVWASRTSPEDKQLNCMHNETDIVGHITSNTSVYLDGEKIEASEMPESFEIKIGSVLYRRWTNPELKARVEKIIAEIKEGKWCVSMECLFKGFDYAVMTPDGEMKLVARNAETAFLTKHLRAYGGKGMVDGHKVGRLLRNITFTGVGLVDKPANPRSVILKPAAVVASEINTVLVATLKESDMDHEKAMLDLRTELDSLKAGFAKSNETFKSEVESKDAAIAGKETLIEELKTSVASLTTELNDVRAAKAAVEEKVTKMETEAKVLARKASLVAAGLTQEEVDATIAKFASVDDEVFASIVEIKADLIAAKKNPFLPKEDEKSKEDKKEDYDEEMSKSLENAKEEASSAALNIAADDQTESAAAAVQAFFSHALNKPSKKNKEN